MSVDGEPVNFTATTDSMEPEDLSNLLNTYLDSMAKIAQNYGAAANEMAKVAAGGDAAAVKAQFGKLGESCKGCHDDFRNP